MRRIEHVKAGANAAYTRPFLQAVLSSINRQPPSASAIGGQMNSKQENRVNVLHRIYRAGAFIDI